MHSSYFKAKKHVKHASLVLCVLIILSTMFIKQHSVFDVSTAFMLAFVMYNVVYIKNWMHLPQKSGSNTQEEIIKFEERNKLQIEDAYAEISTQRKNSVEIKSTVDKVLDYSRERVR